MVPGQQDVRTGHWSSGYALVYRSASVGSIPPTGPPNFFCTFCHLPQPPTEVFCTFCHSICKKKISFLGLYMVPGQKYVRTGHWSSGYALDYRSASAGSIPSTGLPKFFCTFCHLALPPTEVFCTFCHLICKKKKLFFFSPGKNKSGRKVGTGRQMHRSGELHQTALHFSDKCPFRKALIDITIDHCIQITHLSVLGNKSSLRSQQAFHSTKR